MSEDKKAPPKKEPQKVLAFFRAEGSAFGLMEIEIDKEILLKHGKIVSKTEPDIFAIFMNHLTKKARELFEF